MRLFAFIFLAFSSSCQYYNGKLPVVEQVADTLKPLQVEAVASKQETPTQKITTANTTPEEILTFAKSLIGTPYRHGSTDPVNGFDCSGFITYVFNHFNITVPRSSIEFTAYATPVAQSQAKAGDLILFTGTDSTERFIGHMGLVLNNDKGVIQFIHSSSGKAYSVTISPLDKYYMGRFLKIIRIFSR